MKIFKDLKLFQKYCLNLKNKGEIGFVPTMGCLHEGHLSLIKKSTKKSDFTVVSIFVNPLQFGKNEDLSVYPRPIKKDIDLCKKNGVDVLFVPLNHDFYSSDFSLKITETKISKNFCGFFRPTHFDGVVTVVAKLLNLTNPNFLFLGQKDYQQCMVLKKLINDLFFYVKIIICPIIREKSGLALSSRNIYLNEIDKKNAPKIYKSLMKVKAEFLKLKKVINKKNILYLNKLLNKELNSIKGFKLQYAEIVDSKNLEPFTKNTKKLVVLVAGFFGKTRLIDNVVM